MSQRSGRPWKAERDTEREDLGPGVIAGLGVPQTARLCSGQGITEMEEQKENQLPGRFLYTSLSHTPRGNNVATVPRDV